MTQEERNLTYLTNLANNSYDQQAKKKRAILALKRIIIRNGHNEKLLKAYQQATAKFIAAHPDLGYELQGLILTEQDALNKKGH